MSTTPIKEIESMSLAELEAIVAKKRETEIDVLKTEISALEDTLNKRKEALAKLTGEPIAPTKGKRGRKKGFKPAKAPKAGKATGRASKLKEVVLKFLSQKGKDGAHVDDIAKHAGKPKANINAFLAQTGKKHGIVGKGKRSGIYFLK